MNPVTNYNPESRFRIQGLTQRIPHPVLPRLDRRRHLQQQRGDLHRRHRLKLEFKMKIHSANSLIMIGKKWKWNKIHSSISINRLAISPTKTLPRYPQVAPNTTWNTVPYFYHKGNIATCIAKWEKCKMCKSAPIPHNKKPASGLNRVFKVQKI